MTLPLITQTFPKQCGDWVTETNHSGLTVNLDDNQSHAYCYSPSATFEKSNPIQTRTRLTSNLVVTGYNQQGLPFQIIVNDIDQKDEMTMLLVNKRILPSINAYAYFLSIKDDCRSISIEMIKTIAKQTFEIGDAKFNITVITTYRKAKKMYATGFGIGDTGVICRRQHDGQIEQLVAHTTINDSDDIFQLINDKKDDLESDMIIARNDVFNTEIYVGDNLVSYQGLPNPMHQINQIVTTNNNLPNEP